MATVRELVTTWGFEVDSKPLANLDRTLHGLKTAVNTLVTGFALKEFWKLIESTAEAGHEAELTAQKVGVNADKLQAMQYAAKLVNVSQEEMSTGLKFLSRHMYDASLGSSSAMKNFYLLGIKIRDANGHLRQADSVLGDVADKFAAMPDGTRKTALAIELFGRGGLAMIPFLNKGSGFMTKFAQEAKTFGYVMDKDARKKSEEFLFVVRRMEMMFIGIKRQIGLGLMPTIKQMLDKFVEWYKVNREIIQQRLADVVKLIAVGLKMIWEIVSRPWLAAAAGLVMLLTMVDAIPLALMAAAALIYLIVDDIVGYMHGKDSVFGRLIAGFKAAFPNLSQLMVDSFSGLKAIIGWCVDKVMWLVDHVAPIAKGAKALAGKVESVVSGGQAGPGMGSGWLTGLSNYQDRAFTGAGEAGIYASMAARNLLGPLGMAAAGMTANVVVNVGASKDSTPAGIARAVTEAMDSWWRHTAKDVPRAVSR